MPMVLKDFSFLVYWYPYKGHFISRNQTKFCVTSSRIMFYLGCFVFDGNTCLVMLTFIPGICWTYNTKYVIINGRLSSVYHPYFAAVYLKAITRFNWCSSLTRFCRNARWIGPKGAFEKERQKAIIRFRSDRLVAFGFFPMRKAT